jgi:hypothetical protein
MNYVIYKITNIINGKYYIGAHATEDINDSYKGSGSALHAAMREYGRENFKKEIIEYCNDTEHMFLRESEIVNKNFVSDRNTYNIKLGGKGGKGSTKSPAHKEAIRKAIIEKYKNKPGTGGRKQLTDSNLMFILVEQYGIKKAAEKLNIPYSIFRYRYYRAKEKKLPE